MRGPGEIRGLGLDGLGWMGLEAPREAYGASTALRR